MAELIKHCEFGHIRFDVILKSKNVETHSGMTDLTEIQKEEIQNFMYDVADKAAEYISEQPPK